ncbi:MAG: peptidoglycan-binding protein [Pseudomonadota bacterium]|uniref:peptidoglycan-binding domain-containing protein n=1 Tax=Sphingomonas sp. ERG5 TaxID=1381597 RepID=UPI001269B660|nr:peptidoglycan-binding protein [Sphingomonas sp. ERG5]
MTTIGASVGLGGFNDGADVTIVQHLLNACILTLGLPRLVEDGDCGSGTIIAIQAYQSKVLGAALPDGRIDPGGRTWSALAAGLYPKPAKPPAPVTNGNPLSGAAWWDANQATFPNSSRLADLASPFRERVIAFTTAMKAGGARISVGSTLRNPARAKLMLYCWEVANGERAPTAVPTIPGCAINWDHGDPVKSRKAAREMVKRFGIVRKPSTGLSLHTMGRAIDMTINWTGTITVKDAAGAAQPIGKPNSGENNTALHAVGASYGVIKFAYLPADPPHWSDNGH